MKTNDTLPTGQIIHPFIGQQLWHYAGGLEALQMGEQPRAATVAHVYGDRCINIGFLNINGQACHATSVVLLQPGDELTESGFCCQTHGPFEPAKAEAIAEKVPTAHIPSTAPAQLNHDVLVLYPAIQAAMDELAKTPAGMNSAVDRAWNILRNAFWGEASAPAGAAGETDR